MEVQVVDKLAEVGGVVADAVPLDAGDEIGEEDVGVTHIEGVAADMEVQVVDELAEVDGVIADAVPLDAGDEVGEEDVGIAHIEGVAADMEVQVVDELAEVDGVVTDAVPFDRSGATAGKDDICVAIDEEGVAADMEIEVVDELAEAGGVMEHAVPLDGSTTAGRQDDIVATADGEGVAIEGEEDATGEAVGRAGCIGIMCVGYGKNLLGGGEGVVSATVQVDFALDEVGTIGPVDVGKVIGIIAHDEGEETVLIGGDGGLLIVDDGAHVGTLQDADVYAYVAVTHKMSGGIAYDGLIIEAFGDLCVKGGKGGYCE